MGHEGAAAVVSGGYSFRQPGPAQWVPRCQADGKWVSLNVSRLNFQVALSQLSRKARVQKNLLALFGREAAGSSLRGRLNVDQVLERGGAVGERFPRCTQALFRPCR